MNKYTNAIEQLSNCSVSIKKRNVEGFLDFRKHVVSWFKMLNLNPATQTPFIIDVNDLSSMMPSLSKINCGLFLGVYDDESKTIIKSEIIQADEFDSNTKSVLENSDDGIVVLS